MPYSLKCVIVGDGAVGKTCMLVSYATNQFPTEHVPTVFDNYAVTVVAGGTPYTLGLFDTAGQEGYDRLRVLAYPGTDVFLIAFSVVAPDSMSNVAQVWLPEIRRQVASAPFLLVGTQTDLRENAEVKQRLAKARQRPVSTEQGERLARKLGAHSYVECSALTQRGLKNVFDEAILAVLQPRKAPRPRNPLYRLLCDCNTSD